MNFAFAKFAPLSHHHYFRRVAPGAHDAAEADGADADPDGAAGCEAAYGGFAAGEEAGRFPRGVVVWVADVGLHFVDAARARGMVTRDEGAAQVALAQDEIGGRGGRVGIGRMRGVVGWKAALHYYRGVALGYHVDVGAEIAQGDFELVAGDIKGEGVGVGAAGFFVEGGIEVVDERVVVGHLDGRCAEGSRVSGHLVVDGLGDGREVRAGVAAEVDDGFGHSGLWIAGLSWGWVAGWDVVKGGGFRGNGRRFAAKASGAGRMGTGFGAKLRRFSGKLRRFAGIGRSFGRNGDGFEEKWRRFPRDRNAFTAELRSCAKKLYAFPANPRPFRSKL